MVLSWETTSAQYLVRQWIHILRQSAASYFQRNAWIGCGNKICVIPAKWLDAWIASVPGGFVDGSHVSFVKADVGSCSSLCPTSRVLEKCAQQMLQLSDFPELVRRVKDGVFHIFSS